MKPPSDPDLAARLFGASPERVLALMRAAWPVAVGPELARRTEVVALDSGVLRIRVPDATWQRGLLRMRTDILARLRRIAGSTAPRSLGFVEGQVAVGPPARSAAPLRGAPPAANIVAAAQSIADPELRARFLECAGSYLARFAPALAERRSGDGSAG